MYLVSYVRSYFWLLVCTCTHTHISVQSVHKSKAVGILESLWQQIVRPASPSILLSSSHHLPALYTPLHPPQGHISTPAPHHTGSGQKQTHQTTSGMELDNQYLYACTLCNES